MGVVFVATALCGIGSGDGEAVELRWVTAGDVPEPLFTPTVRCCAMPSTRT